MKNPFLRNFRIILLLVTFSAILCHKGFAQDHPAIDSLKQLILRSKQDTSHVNLLLELGSLYDHSIPDTAFLYYQKALDIAEELDYKWGKAEGIRSIGLIHQLQGKNDQAIEYFLEALSLFEEIDNPEYLTECYNNIGYTYNLQGDYEKAIRYFYDALRIAEDLNDKRKTAMSYVNIGLINQSLGSNDKAIECFEKALVLYKEIDFRRGLSICYVNIGITYFGENSFKKSLVYHEKALAINQEINDKRGISICYTNMSEICRMLDMHDKAIQYSLKSIKMFEEMGFKEGMASAYVNIAYLNIYLADSSAFSRPQRNNYLYKAVEYANMSQQLSEEMNSLSIRNQSANALKEAYRKLGNYSKALEFAEIIIATEDSMFREEKTKAIQEIEVKYETEKKQQQIEVQESQIIAKDAVIKQQKTYRNALAAGFLAVILIIIVIVYAYIQKRKDNRKIIEQNEQILEANEELNVLNGAISKQNNEIITSINYAQRIQAAMLPPDTYITELLNENFIYYKPRDIVSGDFYWIKQINQYIILVAADCTGHGVPGAFMSMLGISYLNEIVQRREITQANQVLNELRKQIKYSLRQHGQPDESKDGIDMALCVMDLRNMMMQYSGAYNPLYLIRDVQGKPELKEIKADRMPLGFYQSKDISFVNHDIQLETGDTFYIFSDGFIDQKGGKENKKFMSKNFKNLLLEINDQPMYDQEKILDKALTDWMGSNSQIDDILVIGVRL